MPQARVLEPKTTSHQELLIRCGFRWCTKDARWEKNGNNPQKAIDQILREQPHLRTETKL